MSRFKVVRDNWPDSQKDEFLRDLGRRIIVDTFAWNPAQVSATSSLSTTLTSASYPSLQGLRAGCFVAVTAPADMDIGLSIKHAFVPADNQLTIVLHNTTGAPVNQGSGTWTFLGVLT